MACTRKEKERRRRVVVARICSYRGIGSPGSKALFLLRLAASAVFSFVIQRVRSDSCSVRTETQRPWKPAQLASLILEGIPMAMGVQPDDPYLLPIRPYAAGCYLLLLLLLHMHTYIYSICLPPVVHMHARVNQCEQVHANKFPDAVYKAKQSK